MWWSKTKPREDAGGNAARVFSTAPAGIVERPEHFIPVSPSVLQDKLIGLIVAEGRDGESWHRALYCIDAWRHDQYRNRLRNLVDAYEPFEPDSDLHDPLEGQDRSQAARIRFTQDVESLLRSANYIPLSREDVQSLLVARSPYGLYLDVDLSAYDDLLLYYRGAETTSRAERNPWLLYLHKEHFQVPIFQRLFLLLKLKPIETRIAETMQAEKLDRRSAERKVRQVTRHLPGGISSGHVYLKVFKNIPQIDVEMLFPNIKISFRPFDKLKLFVTAGGGTAAGVFTTVSKLLIATNPIALGVAVFGLSGVVLRQVLSFFNTRNHYMMVLAQRLYFCSLANNRGAISLIADSAEEEDRKEDMLLYVFLARRGAVPRGALPALEAEINGFMAEHCGVSIDFDLDDALTRMLQDGLLRETVAGAVEAMPPDQAAQHIDLLWEGLLDAVKAKPPQNCAPAA